MKKLFTRLFIISLASVALSGCDLFSFSEETKSEDSIELRDYTTSVIQDEEYTYDGKVFLIYEDKTETEVTEKCEFDYSTLDTSTVGETSFTVKYEGEQFVFKKKAYISVIKGVTLLDIEISGYSTFCELNSTYTFDGKVIASFDNGTTKDVTESIKLDTSKLNTSIEGNYKVKISYTEGKTTVSEEISIRVAEFPGQLASIRATDYTTEVEVDHEYTFDGKVIATFTDSSSQLTVDVTSKSTIGTIDTSSIGKKKLSISFKDTFNNITKTVKPEIEVYAKVENIKVESTIEVGVNKGKSLEASVLPSYARDKVLLYESADPSIATVNSSGVVTGKTADASTTITIKSHENESIQKVVTVNVIAVSRDDWTILLYVCGSNLESDYASSNEGAATEDLAEIASVSSQPDDINVVVQAGGSKKWSSTYSSVINKDKTNRFHLKNKSYVSDSQTDKSNMGDQQTLQDFIEWGLNTYPAEKVGLILWNHGGAMTGCCQDEQFGGDVLDTYEVDRAITNARENLGLTDKLEFVGYDCCLMQVQDIAGLNSKHAKYQIASEESEWGYGWSYDKWIDDLFAKKSTADILSACIAGFKQDTNSGYGTSSNDQTLSYLDLSYWDSYQTAWENMATTLSGIITSKDKWSTFASLLNKCQRFGQTYGRYPYDIFDAGHFFTKIKSDDNYKNNSTLMSNITTLSSIYENLVGDSFHGNKSANATGATLFAPVSGSSSKSDYSTYSTPFTVWRNLCINYGTWY